MKFQGQALRNFLLTEIIGSRLISRALRPRLLRLVGSKVGQSYVEAGLRLTVPSNFSIGDWGYINVDCMIDSSASVSLGNGVNLGHEVAILTSSHFIGGAAKRAGAENNAPVIVGNGVWIGARSTVLGGVTIGAGTIIAAASLVLRDCEENCLYAGSPAVLRKRLGASEQDINCEQPVKNP